MNLAKQTVTRKRVHAGSDSETCPFCNKTPRDAVTLQCQHTYCRPCLDVIDHGNGSIKCPKCSVLTPVKPASKKTFSKFMTNKDFARNICSLNRENSRADQSSIRTAVVGTSSTRRDDDSSTDGDDEQDDIEDDPREGCSSMENNGRREPCGFCQEPNAALFCYICNAKTCQGCAEKDQKTNKGKHNIVPLPNVNFCSVHPNDPVTDYCERCKKTGCTKCMTLKHHDHETTKLSSIVKDTKKQLKKFADHYHSFTEEAKTMDERTTEALSKIDSVISNINHLKDALQGYRKDIALSTSRIQTELDPVLEDLEDIDSDIRREKGSIDEGIRGVGKCKDLLSKAELLLKKQANIRTPKIPQELDELLDKIDVVNEVVSEGVQCEMNDYEDSASESGTSDEEDDDAEILSDNEVYCRNIRPELDDYREDSDDSFIDDGDYDGNSSDSTVDYAPKKKKHRRMKKNMFLMD